mmetsp:Transcript_9578/g.14523  ORF Transcript_9578/g.14523 Transcript_9578/m.14523 type:complete len:232 (-) Transcript_9578:21-716(-)
MRFIFPLCLTADSALGKVNKSTLSQQTLMELFIEGISNKELICGSTEDPTRISTWNGLTLSAAFEVVEIRWRYLDLSGSIALQWLPMTTEKLSIERTILGQRKLSGTLDFTSLPESLKYLQLVSHYFEGEISLTTLPAKMEYLDVSYNELSGSLDLTSLPWRMRILRLAGNEFSGVADLSNLPKGLIDFNVSRNKNLEGVIHLDRSAVFERCFVSVAYTEIKTVYIDKTNE